MILIWLGGGSGIGKATIDELLYRGCTVFAVDYNEKVLDQIFNSTTTGGSMDYAEYIKQVLYSDTRSFVGWDNNQIPWDGSINQPLEYDLSFIYSIILNAWRTSF